MLLLQTFEELNNGTSEDDDHLITIANEKTLHGFVYFIYTISTKFLTQKKTNNQFHISLNVYRVWFFSVFYSKKSLRFF